MVLIDFFEMIGVARMVTSLLLFLNIHKNLCIPLVRFGMLISWGLLLNVHWNIYVSQLIMITLFMTLSRDLMRFFEIDVFLSIPVLLVNWKAKFEQIGLWFIINFGLEERLWEFTIGAVWASGVLIVGSFLDGLKLFVFDLIRSSLALSFLIGLINRF